MEKKRCTLLSILLMLGIALVLSSCFSSVEIGLVLPEHKRGEGRSVAVRSAGGILIINAELSKVQEPNGFDYRYENFMNGDRPGFRFQATRVPFFYFWPALYKDLSIVWPRWTWVVDEIKPQHVGYRGETINLDPANSFYLKIPEWWIVMIPAVVLTQRMLKFRRHRARVRQRLCLNCGYDLQGSSNRCPECGAVITLRTA